MGSEQTHTRGSSRGVNEEGPKSARLGGARADFVAGLGKKVADLRNALGRVKAVPEDAPARDELRRKLHALGSAAKMMKFDAMDRGIAEALGTLDRSSSDEKIEELDIEAVEQIIEDLPALAWGDGQARSSRAEAAEKPPAPTHAVLVVGSAHIADALLDRPEDDGRPVFRCESTPDPQAAYDLVRTTEPDLVILDADLPCATELVDALMDDPLTETVPVIVVGSFLEPGEAARYVAMGVAKTLGKPTSREALRSLCEETLEPRNGVKPARAVLGEPTIAELGDRLANEIKEALVGRVDEHLRKHKVPLGEGTEILGAIWGAIARVREVVTARTDGMVRFAGGPEGAMTLAPPLHDPELARSDRTRTRTRGIASEVRLAGRRIVVADDDPAVVWFMADLLKTAGCVVHEAFDGQQALELAYKNTPDLVITDILMPNLDGFSLCRALRRDVALRDTPVILLSWKEDLLQRVRELGAGAAGYVRKESDTRAIVARVREALRPRARVEARLREDGEVRGRLDGVTVRTLLEIVCATRPEARVSVRDASFLYEVEIRMGAPHRATRTNGDGSFMRGNKVLAAMLGASAGRFIVTTSSAPVEADLDGNLSAQLAKPIARSRAATMLLTGPRMGDVAKVKLDEEQLADYLRATPERPRLIARRLANGAAPRALVLEGYAEASLLEDLACDLAARGIVTGIVGTNGADLLGPTVKALLEHTDTRAALAPRMNMTPSPYVAAAEIPPDHCADDARHPVCASPMPSAARSLEDAVLREVIHRSPQPTQAQLPFKSMIDPNTLRPRSSPPPGEYVHTATPPAEQIAALGEATVIDDTRYEEEQEGKEKAAPEPSIPMFDEASVAIVGSQVSSPIPEISIGQSTKEEDAILAAERMEPTPFVSVTASDDAETPTTAAKKKKWPMVAFIAATGIVAWAVLHFSMNPATAPKQTEKAPPPAETSLPDPAPTASDVSYTQVAPEAALAPDQGVLDIAAPADAVIVVDGKEHAKGPLTLPLKPGAHDVRVRTAKASSKEPTERGCTIDVRERRVAHVKF